jgi:hypothetical protein
MTLRPHCLRCGSASVGRDDDLINGRASIGCMMCGNRQYRDTDYVGFEMREEGSRPAPLTNREANIMSAKRACGNCGRMMAIVGKDRCFVCYAAGKGLEGPAQDAAYAAVKEKIFSGGLRRGGRSKSAEIPEAAPPETVHSPTIKFRPQTAQEIPVTIRLTIEVDLRVTGASR